MNKKNGIIKSTVLCSLLFLSACSEPQEPAASGGPQGCEAEEACGADIVTEELLMKEAYESLNGAEASNGNTYREVHLPDELPFEETDLDSIYAMVNEGETFYLYVGDEMCPWCRSVIETAVEAAAAAEIDKIYYVQIWDPEHKEIFRDVMSMESGTLETVQEGSESYYALIDSWQDMLGSYSVKNGEEYVDTGEKRIYAPSFVYVEDGEIRRYTTGISDLQEDAYGELSEEMLAQEREMFDAFFLR